MIQQPTAADPGQIGIIPLTPRSIRKLLMAITAGLLLAHSVVQVGIYGFGAEKHWLDSLNMDRELNLPTLFSSALLLMAALLMQRLGQSSDRIACPGLAFAVEDFHLSGTRRSPSDPRDPDHSRAQAPGAPSSGIHLGGALRRPRPHPAVALSPLPRLNLPSNGITVAAIRCRLHRRCHRHGDDRQLRRSIQPDPPA